MLDNKYPKDFIMPFPTNGPPPDLAMPGSQAGHPEAQSHLKGDGQPREARRPIGFSEHVIVGQASQIVSSIEEGHPVVNCHVVVNPWLRRKNLTAMTAYEVTLRRRQASAFKSLNFRDGDKVLFRLDNISVEAWLDSDGQPKAAIKGDCDKFIDLRPNWGVFQAILKDLEKNELSLPNAFSIFACGHGLMPGNLPQGSFTGPGATVSHSGPAEAPLSGAMPPRGPKFGS
ncbi:MAG: hypothetical protein LBU69_03075 [Deltaproteobacteria bacterium]|jgi:hypothetical protein|nr:hypothetical protein [Deltaproteobacteria bacterium]